MRKRRDDFEDDGRTVADMSGVSRPSLFGLRPAPGDKPAAPPEAAEPPKQDRPWEEHGMSREDRRHYIWGALSAALLIGLAFIVGLGIVIAIMYFRFLF